MKTPFLILLFIGLSHLINAQERINKLTNERTNLYRKYKETESLNTGLFGNHSKQDLQTSIDALKEVIKKDNEILDELSNLQENSKVEFTNKYNDLILQNNELREKNRGLIEITERQKGYTKENHLITEKTEQKQILLISLLIAISLLCLTYSLKYFTLKNKLKRMNNGIHD